MKPLFARNFTSEHHRLFCSIRDRIKACPEYYADGGKYLDEAWYQISGNALREDFWDVAAMTIRYGECFAEDFTADGKEIPPEFVRALYEPLHRLANVHKSGICPTRSLRLEWAWRHLLHASCAEPFLEEEELKAIDIIVWLITDPEAHKAGLGITHFEDWEWDSTIYRAGHEHTQECDARNTLARAFLVEPFDWWGIDHAVIPDIRMDLVRHAHSTNSHSPSHESTGQSRQSSDTGNDQDTLKTKNRPTQADMANRNRAVAMAAGKFQVEHDCLPTVDEMVGVTKYTRAQIYSTAAYKEGKIAKSSARPAAEMLGRSVNETEQFDAKSPQAARTGRKSQAAQAELDALIDQQMHDDNSRFAP